MDIQNLIVGEPLGDALCMIDGLEVTLEDVDCTVGERQAIQ